MNLTSTYAYCVVGLGTGLNTGPTSEISIGLSHGISYGLSAGLSYWLLFVLFHGPSGHKLNELPRFQTNQGIHRSISNNILLLFLSVIAGISIYILVKVLSSWLIMLLTHGVNHGLNVWLSDWLSNGLVYGVLFGLLIGLLGKGLTSIRHMVLRLLLWRTKFIPWNYVRFLDYASERILLRKVGEGYIFIHRLFMDYFASLPFTQ
jgi:hypothetical protein